MFGIMQGATRFSNSLTEAANSLHGGIELQKPEQQYVDSIELKAAAFSRATNDETVLQHFNEVKPLLAMSSALVHVCCSLCPQLHCHSAMLSCSAARLCTGDCPDTCNQLYCIDIA